MLTMQYMPTHALKILKIPHPPSLQSHTQNLKPHSMPITKTVTHYWDSESPHYWDIYPITETVSGVTPLLRQWVTPLMRQPSPLLRQSGPLLIQSSLNEPVIPVLMEPVTAITETIILLWAESHTPTLKQSPPLLRQSPHYWVSHPSMWDSHAHYWNSHPHSWDSHPLCWDSHPITEPVTSNHPIMGRVTYPNIETVTSITKTVTPLLGQSSQYVRQSCPLLKQSPP